MPDLGLSCNVRNGRIVVRGVRWYDGEATEVFHHAVSSGDDLALQLRTLSDDLATRLIDLEIACVVVRGLDYHHATRVNEPTALRLRGEGVLLSTARAHVDHVACLNGKAIGDKCGTDKDEVEARARDLLSKACAEATAAALAAEHLRLNSSHG